MNQALPARITALAIVACAFPFAVRADLSENTILQTGSALNLDTGAVVSSGGDILWNGSTIAPQGSATAYNLGTLGATNFNGLPQSYFVPFGAAGRSTPIAANLLVVGDAFVATSSSGKIAKVLVVANSGGAITLQFTTFGASASTGPAVSQILNNSSLIPPGMPNFGIAPSSIFVVQGSGLADPGTPVLQDTQAAGGLPSTLNGANITVAVGGVTTHPALYYTSPTQLAAVLPAATPVGTGTLTVNYRGANSAPAPIQVVASAVGINQYNQIPIPLGVLNTNIDVGVATDNTTGAVLSFTNSGTPGQTVVVWATGIGADPADSDNAYSASPSAINTPMQVYLGGVLLNVLYQGASVYPGVDVIIFTIPQSIPNGCYVPLVAVTGTVVSNVVTLPIHQGGGICVEPGTRGVNITGDQILKNTQDTLKGGALSLIQTNVTNAKGVLTVTNTAGASFFKDTGLLAGATGRGDNLSPGGCAVYPTVAGGAPTPVGLNAGSITLTPPVGPAIPLPIQLGIKGEYGATLAAGIPSSGGTFTFTGSGGADVGPFTAMVTMSNPLFNWTNQSAAATVDRTQGLTYTWTGGLPGTYVLLGGVSTGSGVTAGFSCRVPVEAGQFTVPSYILLGMPAGSGGTSIQQHDADSTFSATGLDIAGVSGVIEFSTTTTYK
jgi:uncharacterized protein (TIGR03437 family)